MPGLTTLGNGFASPHNGSISSFLYREFNRSIWGLHSSVNEFVRECFLRGNNEVDEESFWNMCFGEVHFPGSNDSVEKVQDVLLMKLA